LHLFLSLIYADCYKYKFAAKGYSINAVNRRIRNEDMKDSYLHRNKTCLVLSSALSLQIKNIKKNLNEQIKAHGSRTLTSTGSRARRP